MPVPKLSTVLQKSNYIVWIILSITLALCSFAFHLHPTGSPDLPCGNSVGLSVSEKGRRVICIYGCHKDTLKGLPSRNVQRFKGRSPCKGCNASDYVKERAHLILFTFIENLVI